MVTDEEVVIDSQSLRLLLLHSMQLLITLRRFVFTSNGVGSDFVIGAYPVKKYPRVRVVLSSGSYDMRHNGHEF